jgi:hypothetical protein
MVIIMPMRALIMETDECIRGIANCKMAGRPRGSSLALIIDPLVAF